MQAVKDSLAEFQEFDETILKMKKITKRMSNSHKSQLSFASKLIENGLKPRQLKKSESRLVLLANYANSSTLLCGGQVFT